MEEARRRKGPYLFHAFKHRHIFISIGDPTTSSSLYLHLSILIRNKDITFPLRLQADKAYRQQRYSTLNHRINEQDQKGNQQLDVVHPQHIDTHTHTHTHTSTRAEAHCASCTIFGFYQLCQRGIHTDKVIVNCRW